MFNNFKTNAEGKDIEGKHAVYFNTVYYVFSLYD